MKLGLKQKVVVVTGASSGIGLETALSFLEEGARVVGASRHVDTLKQLNYGDRLQPIAIDLSQPQGPEQLIEETIATFGTIDVLVNNMAIAPYREGGFLQIKDQDWEQTFQVNLMSMIRASRAALPHMIKQKSGSIINISSESARQPNEGFLDYSAFKASMLSVSKALANEFGSLGIRVNVVSPGPIRTSLWDKPDGFTDKLAQYFSMEKEQAIEHYAKEERKLPLGRIGTPKEVAAVVVFLASEAASFVTGAEYTVNGGSLRTI